MPLAHIRDFDNIEIPDSQKSSGTNSGTAAQHGTYDKLESDISGVEYCPDFIQNLAGDRQTYLSLVLPLRFFPSLEAE
jgi:hypothetical protein